MGFPSFNSHMHTADDEEPSDSQVASR
jgi:hypothetical protein